MLKKNYDDILMDSLNDLVMDSSCSKCGGRCDYHTGICEYCDSFNERLKSHYDEVMAIISSIDKDNISKSLILQLYDFIKNPADTDELIVRVNALLRIKAIKDKLERVSTTDDLTGLHNRKYLQERLEEEISRSKRYGTKLSCILFDIDFFKVVNDMYGYEWGDILLRNIANKLHAMIRKEDILTRYGDEEFLLVLPNTSEDNAFLFGERFRREIEKMEFIPAGEEEPHKVTISGGISTFPCMPDVDEDANTVIRYAEHALYNAKHRGKNKIIQFSQMNLEM